LSNWYEQYQKSIEQTSWEESPDWFKHYQAAVSYGELPEIEQTQLNVEFPGLFQPLPEGFGVPQPANQNFLQKGLGKLGDWGGNVWGSVLEALEVPSDMTERLLGYPLTYLQYNNVPDGYSRWDLAALTYDINLSYIHGGFGKPTEKLARVQQEMVKGTPFSSIMEQESDMWMDLPGKIILDPLWLIGGAGIVAKAPGKLGKAIPGVSKLFPKLGVGGKGRAFELPLIQRAIGSEEKAQDLIRAAMVAPNSAKRTREATLAAATAAKDWAAADAAKMGMVGRLFEYGLIGAGEAPINLYHSKNFETVAKLPILGKGARLARAVLGPKPVEQAMMDVFQKQARTAANRVDTIRTGRAHGAVGWLMNRLIKTKPELRAIQTSHEIETLFTHVALDPQMGPPQFAEILTALKGGREGLRALSPEIRRAMPMEYLEGGLSDALVEFFTHPKVDISVDNFPSLADAALDPEQFRLAFFRDMEHPKQGITSHVRTLFGLGDPTPGEKALGLYKTVLSTTTLNSPAFVVLNAVNNVATLFADYGFDIFRGGLWKGGMQRHLGEEFKVAPHLLTQIVDQSLSRQLFGPELRKAGWRKVAAPFVGVASALDGWARIKAWQIGRERGIASAARQFFTRPANYHLMPEDLQAFIDTVPDLMAKGGYYDAIPIMRERLRAGQTIAPGDAWVEMYLSGTTPGWNTLDDAAKAEARAGLSEPAAQINDIINTTHSADERVMRNRLNIRNTAAHTDEMRRANNLPPAGEAPKASYTPTDLFAFMDRAEAEMGRFRMDVFPRHLTAHDIPEAQVEAMVAPLRSYFEEAAQRRAAVWQIASATEEDFKAGRVLLEDWTLRKEKGTHQFWKNYESWSRDALVSAYDNVYKQLGEIRPELVDSYRYLGNRHIELLKNKDNLRTLAFKRGEIWTIGEDMGPMRTEVDRLFKELTKETSETLGMVPQRSYGYPAAESHD
jgi:hypothetical protein